MKTLILLLVLLSPLSAFAQEKLVETPKLTEVESLKIQIANLQYSLRAEKENSAKWIQEYGQCQISLLKDYDTLNASTIKLQDEITQNHPGFTFDIQKGTFTPKSKETPDKK